MQLENIKIILADPGGNITAIVLDDVPVEAHAQINRFILAKATSVEQVVFLQKRGGVIHGQMAGGEFCGNAARALGYVAADGKKSRQRLTMSGLSVPVVVEVSPGRSKLEMRSGIRHERLLLKDAPISVVHMDGISHAILFSEHPSFFLLKERATGQGGQGAVKTALDELKLTSLPACGLLFVENKHDTVSFAPYVFVRDMGTLCAETACASGSVAVACVLAKDVDVYQPSGEALHITLEQNDGAVKADVDGSMSILWEGTAGSLHC